MKLAVAILAAGASRRMGRPKMLLPWGDTSVIGHLLRLWAEELRARQVAVVCAPPPSPVTGELDRLEFPAKNRIINPAPENGMFSSIQAAAAWEGWDAELTHVALVLGDQPHLSAEMLARVVTAAAAKREIVQPSYRGKARHPVIFPAGEFRAVAGTTHATLRDSLGSAKRTLVEVNDAGLELDVDYPADYEAACEMARHSAMR